MNKMEFTSNLIDTLTIKRVCWTDWFLAALIPPPHHDVISWDCFFFFLILIKFTKEKKTTSKRIIWIVPRLFRLRFLKWCNNRCNKMIHAWSVRSFTQHYFVHLEMYLFIYISSCECLCTWTMKWVKSWNVFAQLEHI